MHPVLLQTSLQRWFGHRCKGGPGDAALLANETLEVTVVFAEALRFAAGMKIQINYGFSTLVEITVE